MAAGLSHPGACTICRRTFVSGCARLRIPSEVTERAINHVSESFGGVRGVYNVHAYEDERRHAMQAWASHLMAVATAQTGNLVRAHHSTSPNSAVRPRKSRGDSATKHGIVR